MGAAAGTLGAAEAVGTFWLVANALARDPALGEQASAAGNVRVAEAANGAGVYEAVITTLAEAG